MLKLIYLTTILFVCFSSLQLNSRNLADENTKNQQKQDTSSVNMKPIEMNKVETFLYPSSTDVEPTEEIQNRLKQFAEFMKKYSNVSLAIIGHSDNIGTFKQNDIRARERAENVKSMMVKLGIPEYRLLASGKGSIDPIASNQTDEGCKMNRRVELKIVPGAPKRK